MVINHGGVELPTVSVNEWSSCFFIELWVVFFCVLSSGMGHRDEFFVVLSFRYFSAV